jgi:hypothetical protein
MAVEALIPATALEPRPEAIAPAGRHLRHRIKPGIEARQWLVARGFRGRRYRRTSRNLKECAE